ncbi:MAG TPA: type I-U CRISPR-associated helicase/endonuclease Cas3 [Candidatus Micrarchaeia archaeon]|nr:type I-U CRISPR-associated helicase/endonuclease Cas3 [Candidatus Micrarchaeia archaeon]
MGDVAPFVDFYRAVNGGREPLPWQARLADQVATREWPAAIGVPTGLGKTGCLDIAVWALAYTAVSGPKRAPTRIWYVVNRRQLVDAAWEHAVHIAGLLADSSLVADEARDVVESVAAVLGSLAAVGVARAPLYVARLRGGADLGARAPDPSQPALLLATVPMFASRWLFRGYGSSTSMRPVDAALAGIDSLVLLDEAHLARPLIKLADRLAQCDTGDPTAVIDGVRSRPVVVALTATGEAAGERFDLDDTDRQHPVVAQRLSAPKRAQLIETAASQLADALATHALMAVGGRAESCVVFANTPGTARAVAERLRTARRGSSHPAEVCLLTGRVRDREGDRIRDRLLDPLTGVRAGQATRRDRPLVVVATQTLEVGADVDFDHLVTETAGVRSLVQRLGRVNRFGTRPDALCVICHPADRTTWPVYGVEPADVWSTLQAAGHAGPVDLSPGNAAALLGPPQDVDRRVGELLPAHLWEWAKTTAPPPGEAPIELFVDGFDPGGDVSIVWRAHRSDDGVRLVPTIRASEAVDFPLHEAREALGDGAVRRLAADRASLETVPIAALRPGDVVVLAPHDGCYDGFGWNPKSTTPVLDVSPLASHTLLLSEVLLDNLAPGCLEIPAVRDLVQGLTQPSDEPESDEAVLLTELRAALRACPPHPWLSDDEWQGFLDELGPVVARPIDDVPSVAPAPLRRRWATVALRADSFDELNFAAASHDLADHLGAVGEVAARIAGTLGLPPPLIEAVRRAGTWHDLGKVDARFQRWLDPDARAAAPLAKSSLARERAESARVASGWPRGARHELLSTRLAASWLDGRSVPYDTALVLHLIASHHGFARPLVRPVQDAAPIRVRTAIDGTAVDASGDLGLPDWDQPARFREVCERYGLWGTALLETIVRQADHLVSQMTEVA